MICCSWHFSFSCPTLLCLSKSRVPRALRGRWCKESKESWVAFSNTVSVGPDFCSLLSTHRPWHFTAHGMSLRNLNLEGTSQDHFLTSAICRVLPPLLKHTYVWQVCTLWVSNMQVAPSFPPLDLESVALELLHKAHSSHAEQYKIHPIPQPYAWPLNSLICRKSLYCSPKDIEAKIFWALYQCCGYEMSGKHLNRNWTSFWGNWRGQKASGMKFHPQGDGISSVWGSTILSVRATQHFTKSPTQEWEVRIWKANADNWVCSM